MGDNIARTHICVRKRERERERERDAMSCAYFTITALNKHRREMDYMRVIAYGITTAVAIACVWLIVPLRSTLHTMSRCWQSTTCSQIIRRDIFDINTPANAITTATRFSNCKMSGSDKHKLTFSQKMTNTSVSTIQICRLTLISV